MRHASILSFMVISCVFGRFDYTFAEKLLVNIDRTIREIDDSTSCSISDWSNNLSDACKCCLIKKVPLLDQGKKAEDIVNECIQKGSCTTDLIALLKKDSADLKSALRQLYTTSVVIKKVTGVTVDKSGRLTEEGAKQLLEKAYAEKKLPYDDFKSVSCLKSQDIFKQEKGLATEQLFLVNSTCGGQSTHGYILKEMISKYNETRNLADFFGLKQLDDLILPNKSKGVPSLSLAVPIAFFQYDNRYLSLLPQAQGEIVDKLLLKYFLNRNETNKKNVEQAYSEIGTVIAQLHQRFMKKQEGRVLGLTVIHADLHNKNIFYDANTRLVTLIDNEAMAATFKKADTPIKDIAYAILSLGFTNLLIPEQIRTRPNIASEWIKLVTAPFLKSYISSYPKEDQLKLFNEIITGLKSFTWVNTNFYNKYKTILDPEFEKVRQLIISQPSPEPHEEKIVDPEALNQALKKFETSLANLAKALA
jgi:hypothetical protein